MKRFTKTLIMFKELFISFLHLYMFPASYFHQKTFSYLLFFFFGLDVTQSHMM